MFRQLSIASVCEAQFPYPCPQSYLNKNYQYLGMRLFMHMPNRISTWVTERCFYKLRIMTAFCDKLIYNFFYYYLDCTFFLYPFAIACRFPWSQSCLTRIPLSPQILSLTQIPLTHPSVGCRHRYF